MIDTSSGRTAKETLRGVKQEAREAGSAVDKLGDEAAQSGRQMRQLGSASGELVGRLARLAAAFVAVRSGFQVLAASLKAADEFAALDNRLKLVIDSSAELESVQKRLLRVSQDTFSSIGSTVQLYQRIAQGAGDFELSQNRLVSLTETVNKAITLSGQGAQAASAALIQFGQALESGVLSGDEFRSIREQAPALAKAIADGLGVTRGELRKLAEDQKLTTEIVIGAIEKQKAAVDEAFGKFDQTFEQTRQKISTAAKVLAAQAFGPLNEANITILDDFATSLGSDETIRSAREFGEALIDILATIQGISSSLGAIIRQLGDAVGLAASVVFPFDAAEFAAEFEPLFRNFRELGELQQQVRQSRILAAEVERAGLDQIEEKLQVIKNLGGEIRIGDQAIESAEDFKTAVDAAKLSSQEIFELFQKQGAFIFPQPQGLDAQSAFSRTSGKFASTDLIVRTEKEADALRKIREEAEKAQAAVRELFSGEVVIPFQDAQALFEAAQISEEALDAKREELVIQKQLNDLAAEFAAAGLSFDRAAAEAMLKETAALEKATDALIDAQRKVREETAKGFEASINQAFARFDGIDFTRTPEGAIGSIFSDVDRTVGNLLKALDELEPVLDDDQIADLRRVILDGSDKIKKGVVEGATEGAKRMREEISGAVGTLLDDLIFNGGRGFDDFFRSFGRDVANDVLIDPISKAFAGDGDIVTNIKGAFDDFNTKFQRIGESIFGKGETGQAVGAALAGAGAGFAGFQVGQGISDLLGITGNKKSVGAGGAIGGGIGFAVAGPIGAAVGAALGSILGGLLSKPSDNAAGGGVNFKTFSPENQFAKNNDPETIAARNELLSATATLAQTIAELTGSNFAGPGISIQVGRRDGTVIQSSAGGSVTTPVGDAQAALDEIFRQLVVSLRGGEKALVDYALAAQKAGRAPDDVIQGLQSLKAIFDLTAEPLSQVEQALKAIDDTVNPVIEDLKSLGLSISNISKVADDAAKAVGKAFIDDIQQQILDAQNGVLGDYKRLVDQIQQRQKDALTLFQRGAITQGELESVQFLGALQTRNFFEGLTPEELASLGDYFGLIGDEIGQTQAALAKLELGITDFVDNVVETVDRLKREAESIQDAVDRALQTRDDILRRFSPLLPGEQLVDLRGQLGQILQDIQDPTASAEFIADQTNLASDLAKQFVDLSAQIFGPTAQFAQNRDFATGILEQIAAVGQEQVDERLTLIEVAEREVTILQEIRDVIASPDPSIPFIQQVLDENRVTNTILTDLLTQYIAAATAQATVLNSQTAQTAADSFLSSQGLTQQPANSNTSAGTQALVDTFIRENQKLQQDNQKLQTSITALVKLIETNNSDQRQILDLQRAGSSFR